jgi:NTE family protein
VAARPTQLIRVADSDRRAGIGLALSGGGFRAMLFHTGAVWRLNEMGLLPSISVISSVSGGSLLNGRLAVRWQNLNFESGVATNYEAEVAEPVLRFATQHVDAWAIGLGLIPFVGAGRITAWFYRRDLVGSTRLDQLPDQPTFVFNATHLPTGISWRFERAYMACYRIGLAPQPRVPLATVLAASAGFPPFLSPVVLKADPDTFHEVDGADLFANRELRHVIPLTDGGVYDNLGLQTLDSRKMSQVLVSDGGGGLEVNQASFGAWTVQVRRVLDVATEQARALRRSQLVAEFTAEPPTKQGALWRTKTDITDPKSCPVPPAFGVHADWPHYMFAIRTRLNPFTEFERFHLVNWGYLVADTVIRSWYLKNQPPPTSLPYPEYGFEAPPPGGRSMAGGPK